MDNFSKFSHVLSDALRMPGSYELIRIHSFEQGMI